MGGTTPVLFHTPMNALPFRLLRFLILHQFDDVLRKTKFIAVKIVPNTTSRGTTPGPKLTASPIIHRRIASVKIVQNTILSPERVVVSRSCSSIYGYVALRDRSVMGFDFGTVLHVGEEPA